MGAYLSAELEFVEEGTHCHLRQTTRNDAVLYQLYRVLSRQSVVHATTGHDNTVNDATLINKAPIPPAFFVLHEVPFVRPCRFRSQLQVNDVLRSCSYDTKKRAGAASPTRRPAMASNSRPMFGTVSPNAVYRFTSEYSSSLDCVALWRRHLEQGSLMPSRPNPDQFPYTLVEWEGFASFASTTSLKDILQHISLLLYTTACHDGIALEPARQQPTVQSCMQPVDSTPQDLEFVLFDDPMCVQRAVIGGDRLYEVVVREMRSIIDMLLVRGRSSAQNVSVAHSENGSSSSRGGGSTAAGGQLSIGDSIRNAVYCLFVLEKINLDEVFDSGVPSHTETSPLLAFRTLKRLLLFSNATAEEQVAAEEKAGKLGNETFGLRRVGTMRSSMGSRSGDDSTAALDEDFEEGEEDHDRGGHGVLKTIFGSTNDGLDFWLDEAFTAISPQEIARKMLAKASKQDSMTVQRLSGDPTEAKYVSVRVTGDVPVDADGMKRAFVSDMRKTLASISATSKYDQMVAARQAKRLAREKQLKEEREQACMSDEEDVEFSSYASKPVDVDLPVPRPKPPKRVTRSNDDVFKARAFKARKQRHEEQMQMVMQLQQAVRTGLILVLQQMELDLEAMTFSGNRRCRAITTTAVEDEVRELQDLVKPWPVDVQVKVSFMQGSSSTSEVFSSLVAGKVADIVVHIREAASTQQKRKGVLFGETDQRSLYIEALSTGYKLRSNRREQQDQSYSVSGASTPQHAVLDGAVSTDGLDQGEVVACNHHHRVKMYLSLVTLLHDHFNDNLGTLDGQFMQQRDTMQFMKNAIFDERVGSPGATAGGDDSNTAMSPRLHSHRSPSVAFSPESNDDPEQAPQAAGESTVCSVRDRAAELEEMKEAWAKRKERIERSTEEATVECRLREESRKTEVADVRKHFKRVDGYVPNLPVTFDEDYDDFGLPSYGTLPPTAADAKPGEPIKYPLPMAEDVATFSVRGASAATFHTPEPPKPGYLKGTSVSTGRAKPVRRMKKKPHRCETATTMRAKRVSKVRTMSPASLRTDKSFGNFTSLVTFKMENEEECGDSTSDEDAELTTPAGLTPISSLVLPPTEPRHFGACLGGYAIETMATGDLLGSVFPEPCAVRLRMQRLENQPQDANMKDIVLPTAREKSVLQIQWIEYLKPPVHASRVILALTSLLSVDISHRLLTAKICELDGHRHLLALVSTKNLPPSIGLMAVRVLIQLAERRSAALLLHSANAEVVVVEQLTECGIREDRSAYCMALILLLTSLVGQVRRSAATVRRMPNIGNVLGGVFQNMLKQASKSKQRFQQRCSAMVLLMRALMIYRVNPLITENPIPVYFAGFREPIFSTFQHFHSEIAMWPAMSHLMSLFPVMARQRDYHKSLLSSVTTISVLFGQVVPMLRSLVPPSEETTATDGRPTFVLFTQLLMSIAGVAENCPTTRDAFREAGVVRYVVGLLMWMCKDTFATSMYKGAFTPIGCCRPLSRHSCEMGAMPSDDITVNLSAGISQRPDLVSLENSFDANHPAEFHQSVLVVLMLVRALRCMLKDSPASQQLVIELCISPVLIAILDLDNALFGEKKDQSGKKGLLRGEVVGMDSPLCTVVNDIRVHAVSVLAECMAHKTCLQQLQADDCFGVLVSLVNTTQVVNLKAQCLRSLSFVAEHVVTYQQPLIKLVAGALLHQNHHNVQATACEVLSKSVHTAADAQAVADMIVPHLEHVLSFLEAGKPYPLVTAAAELVGRLCKAGHNTPLVLLEYTAVERICRVIPCAPVAALGSMFFALSQLAGRRQEALEEIDGFDVYSELTGKALQTTELSAYQKRYVTSLLCSMADVVPHNVCKQLHKHRAASTLLGLLGNEDHVLQNNAATLLRHMRYEAAR